MAKEDTTKYYSNKQEKSIASYLGWNLVSGSGARDCRPGDIVSINWLGECKTHTEPDKKITFKLNIWRKICKEAASKFKSPVLFVDDGSQKIEKTWCLIGCNVRYIAGAKQCEYPKTVKSNIIFNHSELSDICSEDPFSEFYNTIFCVEFDGKEVGICKLSVFKRLFV